MNDLDILVCDLPFLEKFVAVCEHGIVELWEERKSPPNLSLRELRLVLNRIDRIDRFRVRERKSFKGPHGLTGDDFCFYFECDVRFGGILEIAVQRYFIKGYFFDRNDLSGVTIQSFRRVS